MGKPASPQRRGPSATRRQPCLHLLPELYAGPPSLFFPLALPTPSTNNHPPGQSESQLAAQKAELSALILQVLRRHPYLCYFQGYHDIAQVLLLVLPPNAARSQALAHLSLLRIRDFMLPSLSPALAQLHLIPDILRLADPPLWHHLSRTAPFFALAGTLTMYAHDVTTLGAIARLFDALLAAPDPALSVYLFAAAVRARRADLFATPRDDPDVLHCILAKLPAQPLDWEALIPEARELLGRFPPERLPAWRRISRWSVLKTARRSGLGEEGQSVEMGREWFGRQAAELRWQEKKERARKWLWRHRRPAGAVGVAVLVAVLAVLLRRGPLPGPLASGAAYVSGLLARWWR